MTLFFRDEEMRQLQSGARFLTRGSQAVFVRGRSGIGKSALAREFLENSEIRFVHVSLKKYSTGDALIRMILQSLLRDLGLRSAPRCLSLAAVFDYVFDVARTSEFILCVDEADELGAADKTFWREFSGYWNQKSEKIRILLVFCVRKIDEGDVKSLKNSKIISLKPFSLVNIRKILFSSGAEATAEQCLLLHCLTGGVPRYVMTFVRRGAWDAKTACELFRSEDCYFRLEGERLLKDAFFASFASYAEILRKMASGVQKRTDLQREFSGNVGGYLSKLEHEFHLVHRLDGVFGEKTVRKSRWAINDGFLIAWFSLIEGNESFEKFLERRFAALAGQYLAETGAFESVGPWWDRSGRHELPLVALSRGKATVFLPSMWGEMPRAADFDRALRSFSETMDIPEHRICQKALSSENLFSFGFGNT